MIKDKERRIQGVHNDEQKKKQQKTKKQRNQKTLKEKRGTLW